jgi:DNA-binding NtrC family response regulator
MPRVLIVDDEVALLHLMKRYLDRVGYEVETCADSQAALDLFVSDPHRFELVVVDLSMPQLPGRELVARIGDANGDTGVLVCSGEPFDCRSIPHPNPDRIKFLQKPFAAQMLADAVGEIIASAPARASDS